MAGHESGKWKGGQVSGGVYHGGEAHLALMNDVYAAFDVANSLHPDVWPSVMKFEAEVIAMTANLMNGGFLDGSVAPSARDVCGCMTSGGTESIVCATKAHREWARAERGIDPDDAVVVAPATAHAAIDKACELLRIRLIKVPVRGPSFAVDPAELARAVTANTVMIYASAPQFPHGVVDPVGALGRIARDAGCGLHVDCCLGGFVLPFQFKLRQLLARGEATPGDGHDPRLDPALRDMLAGLEPFDFTVPGVTSMSVDTHKYGYASKGTSVVLYRHEALRRCQYFAYPDWPGGLYVTPCIAGSTPGALRAACWASMVSLGEAGYVGAVRSILECALAVRAAVEATPELVVLGEPRSMIVAFAAAEPDKFNIYSIGDVMAKKGWSLNSLQHPACIHLCVTLCTVRNASRFRGDLAEAIEEVRANGAALAKQGNAPIYGMASSVPGGAIKEVLAAYVDTVLSNPDP